MNFILSEEIVNKILNYLASRPYKEVVLLINELQTSINVVPTSSKEKKSEE